MISLNEYDDIVTILFLPLKGANVVKEFQNTHIGLMNFCFTISCWEIPSKESRLDKLGKLIIYLGIGYQSRR